MSDSERRVLQDASEPPAAASNGARRLVPRLVLVALLVAAAAAGVRAIASRVHQGGASSFSVANQQATDSQVRHRVVEFDGSLLADGRAWSSTSAHGSILVVNYWASWCGPCRAEQPSLTAVARAYGANGVRFLGINFRDSQAAARTYTQEFKVPYPSLFDPAALTAAKLQPFALPTTFILDRDGMIAYQLTGKTTVPILSARLDALLARGGRWAG